MGYYIQPTANIKGIILILMDITDQDVCLSGCVVGAYRINVGKKIVNHPWECFIPPI